MDQMNEWWDRRKALDPMEVKPKFYTLTISVGSDVDGSGNPYTGAGSLTLDNTPFVLDSITHSIVGADRDAQDGQYSLLLRDEQTSYQNLQGMAEALFGSVASGFIIPLPLRVFFRGSATLSVEVTNFTDRTADFPTNFPLQIVFHGFERWSRPRV